MKTPAYPHGCRPWLDDDTGPRAARPCDHLIDARIASGAHAEHALAPPARRNLMIPDDPAEAAGRDQHEANTVVHRELQRLRDAILSESADGLEAETVAVERERRAAIGRLTTTGVYRMRVSSSAP
jgi:hypothetical protein